MARPDIRVQHFIGCLNSPWEGVAGPNTPRTLEGVALYYNVPPDAEPMFEYPEFWLYARLFRMTNQSGKREFSLRVLWNEAPTGPRTIMMERLGKIRFGNFHPHVNAGWALRPMIFPGLGQYEFRLRIREQDVLGSRWRIVAREYIWITR
jgi:hypothetical protein